MATLSVGTSADDTSYSVSSVRDYWQLLKPRIMYLVVFTATTGILIAPGEVHPFICLVSILCIALGSGAAGALNMWYDSDIDAIMHRTKNRPIPSGKISRVQALECGLMLSVLAVFIMAISVNYISAVLLLGSIFSYVVVYTMFLKRRSSQNIVIGGIAGALPPIIGWTSVTGKWPSMESLILFAIIFAWTPPHFWALSLLNCDEYRTAGIPMMPVYCTRKTKIHMLGYSILLFMTSLLTGFFAREALLYEIMAVSLGTVFLTHTLAVLKEEVSTKKTCMGLFSFSIYYLFLLFSATIICF